MADYLRSIEVIRRSQSDSKRIVLYSGNNLAFDITAQVSSPLTLIEHLPSVNMTGGNCYKVLHHFFESSNSKCNFD